jgi:endogenous inhibitor of DNA gyrase (YacG/DUF329 family)
MLPTFICKHCGKEVPRNPRIKKNQDYCSKKDCQRARMRNWKKRQYSNNQTYREKCLESQRLWRKNYPSHEYQRDYRKKHPEYVNRNRELQKKRNKKRRKQPSREIVNTDALLLQPRVDGSYTLKKIAINKIVNRNALSLYPSVNEAYAILKLKGGKIVNRNALIPQR